MLGVAVCVEEVATREEERAAHLAAVDAASAQDALRRRWVVDERLQLRRAPAVAGAPSVGDDVAQQLCAVVHPVDAVGDLLRENDGAVGVGGAHQVVLSVGAALALHLDPLLGRRRHDDVQL